MESVAVLKVREQDVPLIKEITAECEESYKSKIGKPVTLKINTDSYLPADTCGGIEVSDVRGRIKIVNTLESRLELIAQQLLPQIRSALFGRNPSRKFAD